MGNGMDEGGVGWMRVGWWVVEWGGEGEVWGVDGGRLIGWHGKRDLLWHLHTNLEG